MRRDRSVALLLHALHRVGLTSWRVAALVLFVIFLIEAGIATLASLLGQLVGESVLALLGLVLLASLIGYGHTRGRRYTPMPVVKTLDPHPETLVLYLSPALSSRLGEPSPSDEKVRSAIRELGEKLRNAGDRPQGALVGERSPWRMPLEAILRHRRTLRRVVVVPSHETARWLGAFAWLVRDAVGEDIHVQAPLRDGDGVRGFETIRSGDIEPREDLGSFGIDLQSLVEIQTLTHGIFLALEREGVPTERILLDVTGGTGLCNVAGAAATLPLEGRILQWIHAPSGQEARFYTFSVTLRPEMILPRD